MNEEITKAVRALEKAKQTLDDESLSLNRNLDHIEAHINAALTALREQPAHVGVKRWHEEITGMVPGSALYEGQQEYVRYEDYLSALHPFPALQDPPAPTKPVAFRYRYEPGLQWHVAQFEDQLPKRDSFPHSQVEGLAPISALQPSPTRDYGKMMKPPADATHCGGYPVNPTAREEAEALVKRLRSPFWFSQYGAQGDDGYDDAPLDAAAFIARHHLGEKP
jgi:hypothetical protein